jgi:hypothetical protein
MKLPTQAQPVSRTTNVAAMQNGVSPSNAGCTACCIAANVLPWPLSIAAKAACGAIPGCGC